MIRMGFLYYTENFWAPQIYFFPQILTFKTSSLLNITPLSLKALIFFSAWRFCNMVYESIFAVAHFFAFDVNILNLDANNSFSSKHAQAALDFALRCTSSFDFQFLFSIAYSFPWIQLFSLSIWWGKSMHFLLGSYAMRVNFRFYVSSSYRHCCHSFHHSGW